MASEGNESHRNDPDLLPPKVSDGKDELNLAEFPLSAIADRLDPSQKTLVFQDCVFDASRNEMVTRQLTITASDKFGLPTALDDEVILGLIKLSKFKDFADRHVPFTRYQLIQQLDWRNESKSYERLETSLKRWMGVTLYYKNAWWDREHRSWVDETFHILDNVSLHDREKAKRQGTNQSQLPLSVFTWNEVIFRSFKAGNLKSIDFDFYKSLESAIAKRLYRFLDKRFYHRPRQEFDLHVLAWEHVGLSRNYETSNLRRKLLPAIHELEARGFLTPIADDERFRKIRSGEWRVVFERARPASPQRKISSAEAPSVLSQALMERGVTPSTAIQTVVSYPSDRIQARLEVFDWLVAKKDSKVTRNPAGFLIASIKSEYAPPRGFVSEAEKAKREAQAEARRTREQEKAEAQTAKEEAQRQARETAVQQFWKSLSDQERSRLEAEALAGASNVERDVLQRGGGFAATMRKCVLDAYALKMLQEGA